MDLEWLDKLTEGWAETVPDQVVSGLIITALLVTPRLVWRLRSGILHTVEMAVRSALLGGLVLWLVPKVDRSEPGVFWPDLPPERLAAMVALGAFGLWAASGLVFYVWAFPFFHYAKWRAARVGIDHGDLTFGEWLRRIEAAAKQARRDERSRFWRPLIDWRQKRAGRSAGFDGEPVTANPFPADSPAGVAWATGYQEWAVFSMETRAHWLPSAPDRLPWFPEGEDPLWGDNKMPSAGGRGSASGPTR